MTWEEESGAQWPDLLTHPIHQEAPEYTEGPYGEEEADLSSKQEDPKELKQQKRVQKAQEEFSHKNPFLGKAQQAEEDSKGKPSSGLGKGVTGKGKLKSKANMGDCPHYRRGYGGGAQCQETEKGGG